jgi:uncharacterized protein
VQHVNRHHSIFELSAIVCLVVIACWPALAFSAAGTLPVLQGIFLVSGYLLVRLLVGRFNRWVGKLVFSVALALLATDILIQHFTGLQLNLFVFSVLLQPDFSNQIGVPGVVAYGGVLMFMGLCLYAARRFKYPAFTLKGRQLLVISAMSGLILQLSYAALFFQGAAEVEEVRRKMPFFTAPHPYSSAKIVGWILPKTSPNPFAISARTNGQAKPTSQTDVPLVKNPQNLLIIIADSLRAKDIAADNSLAPNLFKWAQKGTLALDHYSTSNCTHFSFYSLFTGRLPTGFGAARRKGTAVGLMPELARAGYKLSTAEATPLDWYDTASIILPRQTMRYISKSEASSAREKDVTDRTISTLDRYQTSGQPFAHLAYYFGTHYPYDTGLSSAKSQGNALEGPQENTPPLKTNTLKYQRAIRAWDKELGKLLTSLDTSGLLANTLVMVTADHGEEFLDTGLTGHASRLSNEQLQVPFLLIAPGIPSAQPIRVINHQNVAPYLLRRLTGVGAFNPQPAILAGCGYDYPSSFALFTENGRVDFNQSAGYLTPARAPDGSIATKALQLKGAAILIERINADKTGSEQSN